ncbi:UNVERIFIED_CONTAM: hypothetical protein PYX00_010417 [Menopon gallinae]|uniref:Prolyl endopeptidase n=1 Tax=Menopon gallinae TaxID=328185 RepID=A0AAW2HFL2_9NEOP
MFKYPEVRRDENVIDNYFGVEVKDPYRWLEDPDSEETQKFVENQNAITRPYLDKCPYRNKIKERLTKLWDFPKYGCPHLEGKKYYFSKNTGLQNQSVLYVQDTLQSEPEVFLDPNLLSDDGTVALMISEFSDDGSRYAYALSSSGSDWMSIHFKDTATKKDFPEVLEKVKYSNISWTHDNKGIFYGMYPDQKGKTDGSETVSNEFQKMYYHRVGTPQSEDILVVEFPEDSKIRCSSTVSDCGRYLIISTHKTCRDNLVYFCDLEKINYNITGKLPLTQVVFNLEADYDYVTNIGPEMIFRTNKNAPNYRLIKINFDHPEEKNWTTLIPEHPEDVLEWACPVNKDKLVVCYIQHVKNILQYRELSNGSLIHNFPLEVCSVVGFSGKKKNTEIFYKITSFLTPGVIYRCDLTKPKLESTVFKEIAVEGFNKDLYTAYQVFYTSKDGTRIPMFLVHKKDLVKNSNNSALLFGYGGFNVPLMPGFSESRIVYIQHMNGVYAMPNIRGGGEYGEKWHNGGRLGNKQNVFDDFQSAAEYLIKEKYTTNKLLTIKGGSNGGLLVCACITQRPDLFGAAICQASVIDMLRFHKFTIGSAWVSDYGCSDEKHQFEFLHKYSPLHNVRVPSNNIQFPATLLTTADHDDRVVPLHSLKFIATLQNVLGKIPNQHNPLLIRIETKAGHGAGKPTTKLIEESTDLLCFMIEALGLEFKD